jgi:hypothetical protein
MANEMSWVHFPAAKDVGNGKDRYFCGALDRRWWGCRVHLD